MGKRGKRAELNAQNALTPTNATGTGADCFKNGAAVDGFQKRIVFGLVARQFHGVAFVGDINHATPEDIGHALHLFTFFANGASWPKVEKAGLTVMEVADAVKAADVVLILLPDEQIADVYRNDV